MWVRTLVTGRPARRGCRGRSRRPGSARRGSRWTWRSTTSGCPARSAIRWATRCGRRATAGCRCGSPSTTTRRSPSRGRSSRRRRGRSRRCWSSSACRSPRSRAGATSCTTSTSCATARRCGPARRTGRSTPGSARRTCSWRSIRPSSRPPMRATSPAVGEAARRQLRQLRHAGRAGVRPWFCPGRGPELSHRIAKRIGAAQRRVRIASPVLTAGPILGTLCERIAEGRLDIAGVCDATQIRQVFQQWERNPALAVEGAAAAAGARRSSPARTRPRTRPARSTTSCTRR